MNDVQRVGAKVFCREGAEFPLVDIIPIFHGWIQRNAVPGMLIDVADYSHVPDGPGVVLVSHEGIYSMDETGSRRGLAYAARFPGFETLLDCLRWTMRCAIAACVLLEKETDGKIRFAPNELEIYVNDRLRAPNDARCEAMLSEHVRHVLGEACPGITWNLTRDADPRQRLSLSLRSSVPVDLAGVAERLLR